MTVDDLDAPFTLAERRQVFGAITAELTSNRTSRPIEEVTEVLKRLLIGIRRSIPTLRAGTRLFRVRTMSQMPRSIAEVGAPPEGSASIGRLNAAGKSVLYLSDTPDTAIKELRLGTGAYCLSEWRVTVPQVALVNGGISDEDLCAVFGQENRPGAEAGDLLDDDVRHLFRSIFTLVPDHNPTLYRWSISAAMASGFAHLCERIGRYEQDGHTTFKGLYPFAGIAYASVRNDQRRVNFAFNDLGKTYVDLKSVQWVKRNDDGSISGLDFAKSWARDGRITWLGRSANFEISAGGRAKLTKVGEHVWTYEALDGDVPGFA